MLHEEGIKPIWVTTVSCSSYIVCDIVAAQVFVNGIFIELVCSMFSAVLGDLGTDRGVST